MTRTKALNSATKLFTTNRPLGSRACVLQAVLGGDYIPSAHGEAAGKRPRERRSRRSDTGGLIYREKRGEETAALRKKETSSSNHPIKGVSGFFMCGFFLSFFFRNKLALQAE